MTTTRSWIRNLFARRPGMQPQAAARHRATTRLQRRRQTRLGVEDLEQRTLLTSWTALGPAPLGTPPSSYSGRIVGIAASRTDANTIYIAAAGGGVWKTTNGGSAWTPLTDGQVTLSMGAIALAPSNAYVIYAGTGEANNGFDSNYGRGILVSTNGGINWTLTGNSVFDRKAIAKIAVDPTTPHIAYAAVNDVATNGTVGGTGIYKTTNDGTTWTNTTGSIDTLFPYSDVVIDPNNANTVYMAIGYAGGATTNGVYKSTNAGGSWTKLAGGLPTDGTTYGRVTLAVAKSNSQVVYVSMSQTANVGGALFKMMRSDNGGTNWTDLTAGTPNYLGGQGWYATTLIVDPTSSAIVYAGGLNVIRSTNSGGAWTDITSGPVPQPHADHHGIAFDANGKLLDGDDGGIFRLENPATPQWSNLNTNLNTIQLMGIGLHPTDRLKDIGGSQDNGTEIYTGNPTWAETDGGDGGFAKFSPTNGSRAYHQIPNASAGTNFFRRSDDGGNTWVTKTSSISADVNKQKFYAPFVVDPGNGDRVLYGTNRIWETTTAGDSWAPISPVLVGPITYVDAIGLAASDVNTIYASFDGQFAGYLFVTTDHGANWNSRLLPSNAHAKDLEVDPTNAQIAYAVVNRFGGGRVFRTTNAGVTWTDISGNLPSLPTWTLQLAKPASGDVLYVGNDDGVYTSTNLGGSWSRLGDGFPHAQVFQLALNSTLGILGAGTHGRGMWTISVVAPAGWAGGDLSALGGGPHAAGGPAGYVTPDGTARVVYQAVDGDVHELFLIPGQSWHDGDLSAQGGGPQAASAPFGYVTPDGTARVVYMAVDGDVHELDLVPGQSWVDGDLSAQGGGPHAASAPFGYVTPDGTARVVYMAVDNDVHELFLIPGQSWHDGDLSAQGGGPHTASGAVGYVTPNGTARVVYMAVDNDVHELSLVPGQSWHDLNLSADGGGPHTASAPFGYVTPDGTARVVYMATDNDVHELYLLPGFSPRTDPSSGREISMGISALPATASVSMDSMPMAPSSGRDRDAYELRLESGSTADSEARLAEALTEVFTKGDPAQWLSWQPALLPLEALDAFYRLSAN
jgi:hypothetical protein